VTDDDTIRVQSARVWGSEQYERSTCAIGVAVPADSIPIMSSNYPYLARSTIRYKSPHPTDLSFAKDET
jgi:hypothetical protein